MSPASFANVVIPESDQRDRSFLLLGLGPVNRKMSLDQAFEKLAVIANSLEVEQLVDNYVVLELVRLAQKIL